MKFTVVIVMRRSNWLFWLLCLLLLVPCAYARDVSQADGNLLLTPNHGQGEAWGKARCINCHVMRRLHNSVPEIKEIVENKGFATCTGCHGKNGTQAIQQCLICHNVNDLPANPPRTGKHRHDFNLKKDLPTTSAQCVVCHAASDMDGVFEVRQDLTLFNDKLVGTRAYKDVNDFCVRCHNNGHQQKKWPIKNAGKRDQSKLAEENYLFVDKHGVSDTEKVESSLYPGLRDGYVYNSIVDCVDCHTMHGTENAGLIIDNSLKGVFLLNPALRKQGIAVEILDGVNANNELVDIADYSQLCVLCHDMQIDNENKQKYGGNHDTGNGLSGVHFEYGSDCVTCHSHGERVQKGL